MSFCLDIYSLSSRESAVFPSLIIVMRGFAFGHKRQMKATIRLAVLDLGDCKAVAGRRIMLTEQTFSLTGNAFFAFDEANP